MVAELPSLVRHSRRPACPFSPDCERRVVDRERPALDERESSALQLPRLLLCPGRSRRLRSCRTDDGRDLRARHNLGYWLGRDFLGIGVGAVSTVGGLRWRNAPSLPRYLAALARAERPQRELEQLEPETAARERVMLGLRLDLPLELADLGTAVDRDALVRLQRHGLVEATGGRTLELTRRGRFLGGGVTAELLVES